MVRQQIFGTIICCANFWYRNNPKYWDRWTQHLSKSTLFDDEFRFNDTSTYEGHLRQIGILTWFGTETAIIMSYIVYESTLFATHPAVF